MRLGDAIQGQVPFDHKLYRVRSKTPKLAIMEVFDSRLFFDESVPGDASAVPVPDTPSAGGTTQPPLTGDPTAIAPTCEDPADQIDLMVLYTQEAAVGAEGWTPPDDYTPPEGALTPIEQQVHFATTLANDALENSGDPRWLRLVYVGPAPKEASEAKYRAPEPTWATSKQRTVWYLGSLTNANNVATEVGAVFASAPNFEPNVVGSDPTFDGVQGRRDSMRADLVSVVYESLKHPAADKEPCGWADPLVRVADPSATSAFAFSVVKRSCSDANLILAHEIGHNLGADHECSGSSGKYNCGHVTEQPSDPDVEPWRTVMAYGDQRRIANFSNPEVNYPDSPPNDPTGKGAGGAGGGGADNARALDERAGEVSQYRCQDSGSEAYVWMKDDWEDQGVERTDSNPATAMWRSPYIWLRQSEDVALEDESQHFLHEHQHQNAVKDAVNHVYVKLLNTGGKPQTAPLELYYADANVAPNDPDDWTLVEDSPKNVTIGAHTVEVVRIPWTAPGTGPHSLLARWKLDGTDLQFTNLASTVHASNDLVWRNVHLIDLGEGPEFETEFAAPGDVQPRGPGDPDPSAIPDTYLVITTNPMSHRKIDWNGIVKVSMRVDPDRVDLSPGVRRIDGLQDKRGGVFGVPLDEGVKLLGPFQVQSNKSTPVKLKTSVAPSSLEKVRAQLTNPVHYDITVMQIRPSGVKNFENPSKLFRDGAVIGGISYTLRVPARP
jgi:hypothetical protein